MMKMLCDASRPEPNPLHQKVWAVVLAGGSGSRLRNFVRHALGSERPKQFCTIIGTRSMLRHTWDRAARVVDPARIVTVITAGQERYLEQEARQGVPGTVLVQPANKDTAPGLVLPLAWIERREPGATAAVFPADHFIWREERFTKEVRTALAVAEYWPHRLTLMGAEAEGPETGYGWIAPGPALAPGSSPELYAVRRFWEKPDRRTAGTLFANRFLWNTFVLAGRVETYLGLVAALAPRVVEALRPVADGAGTAGGAKALREAYRRIPPISLSHSVLAGCPEALMVLAMRDVGWSDWGDAGRIVRTLRHYDRHPKWLPDYADAVA